MSHVVINNFCHLMCVQLLDGSQDMIISPFSLFIALVMFLGAAEVGHDTHTEMCELLGIKPENEEELMLELSKVCKKLTDKDSGDSNVKLIMGNSLFVVSKVKEQYKNMCKTYFDAEVFPICTKEVINGWVSEKTHNMIKHLISEDPKGPSVGINFIYLDAMFEREFKKEKTKQDNFYPDYTKDASGEPMQVMMMETTDNFNVSVRTAATVVELNYGDGNTMTAYIVLPKISVDVGSAMNQIIGTFETWEKVVDHMSWENVNLFLPKMKKVTELSLNEPLQKMEMSTVFSSKASLNRLIDEDAYLEKALQVCAIEMTEVGMKVAVATMMKSGSRGGGEFRQTDPIVVRVDRPFGIVIMQKDLKVILFEGIIKKPEMIEEQKA